jgi:hypothetical protein
MTGRSWHADGDTLRAYTAGVLDDVRAYSLEAHLLSCEACREQVAGEPGRLSAIWSGIEVAVDQPTRGVVERMLVTFGLRDHVARLIAATPSMRVSWLASQAVVLGLAALLTTWLDRPAPERSAEFLFLVVAAVLPVVGIALAYGPKVDPTYEVGVAAPLESFRLLLLRAIAVLATSTVITLCVAVTFPGLPAPTVAWILPSLGLVATTLALSSYLRPIASAIAVVGAWLFVGMVVTQADDAMAMFGPAAQLSFVVVIGLASLVLLARRGMFEQEASR